MKELSTIGIDLAKNIFYLHGLDKFGNTVLKKKLSRSQILPFFSNLLPCLVGMEAGGGSHYWAREIKKLGHDTKLMAPQFVKPYLKSNKTDANDAEAISEAVTRPSMRFVGTKSTNQQDIQCVHRIRERLVSSKTALANEIRGLLSEYGIVFPKGIRQVKKNLQDVISDETNQLNPFTREIMQDLYSEMVELLDKVAKYDKYILSIVSENEVAQKLTTIPGVGPIAATAIVAMVADPSMFRNGREFASYLGLVPRQSSSGGKQNLLGISKRGDRYIRTMLIHGARVMVAHNESEVRKKHGKAQWIAKLKERRGFCKTTVALANKNARICWALMSKDQVYSYAA